MKFVTSGDTMSHVQLSKRVKAKLAQRIREIRDEKGLSQREVAGIMEVDPSVLNRIEQGKANPTVETLLKLSSALEVELIDLFSEEFRLPLSEIFTELSPARQQRLMDLAQDLLLADQASNE